MDNIPLSKASYGIDLVKKLCTKQGVLPNSFSFTKVDHITIMPEELHYKL